MKWKQQLKQMYMVFALITEGVVIIDSCEYFVFSTYTDVGYSHKGNCRFCQERRQQELKELVKQIKGE